MRIRNTVLVFYASILICFGSLTMAQEALTTVTFDPATGAVSEAPFPSKAGDIVSLIAENGSSIEIDGSRIELSLLEAFADASPTSAPHADSIPLDNSLDIPFGIIGEDDRIRVNPTNIFPARAMTHILFKTGRGRENVCSGSMIAPDTVLTAGHCVFHNGHGGWATDYRVVPGRNGILEYFPRCGVVSVLTLKGWMEEQSRAKDLAALKLDCSVGADTGYLGMRPTPADGTVSVTLQGYPGEAKLRGLQVRSGDEIRTRHEFSFDHEADTTGGMSGAPVMDDNGTIIGVHTATTKAEGWTRDNQIGVVNHATRLTERRLALIQHWIKK